MFRLNSSLLLIAIFVFSINVTIGTINESVVDNIEHLFSLWTMPCSQWLNVFTNDAVWYHPKFPEDGQIRMTISGHTNSSSLYHVMVPYVYGQIQNENNSSLFINSGFEYVQLVNDYENRIRINRVVEFFNRASLPFVWPPNN
ncbi:unnamed protein product [Rotaria socialis]|uniref:Uncharacterized protein n=1 Tax=Rotaria socialis TaxID=392032 RepID=A0A821GH31_9BILA|nr:unnamed protein product [Rotaria socialis]CAF4668494.1 unnamed protein product [Rotaria socialis]